MNTELIGKVGRITLGGLLGGLLGAIVGDLIAERVYWANLPSEEPDMLAELERDVMDTVDHQKKTEKERTLKKTTRVVHDNKPSLAELTNRYKNELAAVAEEDDAIVQTKSGPWSCVTDMADERFNTHAVVPATFFEESDVLEVDESGVVLSDADLSSVLHFDMFEGDPDLAYVSKDGEPILYEVARVKGTYWREADVVEEAPVKPMKKKGNKKNGDKDTEE